MECSCGKGDAFSDELGACCPEQVFIPACAPCPGVGGLEEVLNDAGCLIGYSCTCDLGEELGQCMSDEECGTAKCTAATDCLTLRFLPALRCVLRSMCG